MGPAVCRRASVVLVVLCWLALPDLARGQEPGADPIKVLPFFDTDTGVGLQYSLMCVGSMPPPAFSQPWGVLVARELASKDANPLLAWKFVFDRALPLNADYLDAVRDRRPLPDLRFKELKELKGPDLAIYLTLNQALRRSDQATQEMFEKSADDNKDVVFANLNTNSPQYRGKVIAVKGKLSVIRRVEAPRLVKDDLDFVYTAYIQGPTKGAPPYTVIFTELPAGLEVSEQQNANVTMHGYYLGLTRFQADKEQREVQKDVISPYLVGKTLIVNKKEPAAKSDDGPYSYYLIVGTLGVIIAIGFFVVAVNIWFRRGDNKIQSQLAQVRDKHTPFKLEPSDEAPGAGYRAEEFKNEPEQPAG